MKYKKTATVVAGTLLALTAGTPAHADDTTDHPTTDDVGHLIGHTGDLVNALRHGDLSRHHSLVEGNPKRTRMTLAGIPLGVSTPD
jgi:hypothetical protein